MKHARAIGFGALLWVFIFVIYSVIMFLPWFQGKPLEQNVAFWFINIPLVLLLAKWYFKTDPPTWKKGICLGLIAIIASTVLDLLITVPLFVKSYGVFYSDWKLYFGFLEMLILTTLAGAEFDATFSKKV